VLHEDQKRIWGWSTAEQIMNSGEFQVRELLGTTGRRDQTRVDLVVASLRYGQ
jgi:hypothetical protein